MNILKDLLRKLLREIIFSKSQITSPRSTNYIDRIETKIKMEIKVA